MPRYIGRNTVSVWWEILALIALVAVVVIVLALTGIIPVFD